jgi:hypothetical protein
MFVIMFVIVIVIVIVIVVMVMVFMFMVFMFMVIMFMVIVAVIATGAVLMFVQRAQRLVNALCAMIVLIGFDRGELHYSQSITTLPHWPDFIASKPVM